MSEIGIDISKHQSKSINEFMEKKFDYVITVLDTLSLSNEKIMTFYCVLFVSSFCTEKCRQNR